MNQNGFNAIYAYKLSICWYLSSPGTLVGLAPPSTWHLFKRLNAFSSNKISASATTLRSRNRRCSGIVETPPEKRRWQTGTTQPLQDIFPIKTSDVPWLSWFTRGFIQHQVIRFFRGTPNNLLSTLLLEVAVAWNATEKLIFSLWNNLNGDSMAPWGTSHVGP